MTEQDEAALQLSLVDFRTMPSDMQKAFLVGALDEFCLLAASGKLDHYTADQIIKRANRIAFLLSAREPRAFVKRMKAEPPKARIVNNG